MPAWQRTYVITCAAVIGYALGYTLSDFGQWPKLVYFPIERTWGVHARPPGTIPMAYVGMIVWGVIGASVTATVAAVVVRLRKRELGPVAERLWGGWALTAFAFSALYFLWNLWPF